MPRADDRRQILNGIQNSGAQTAATQPDHAQITLDLAAVVITATHSCADDCPAQFPCWKSHDCLPCCWQPCRLRWADARSWRRQKPWSGTQVGGIAKESTESQRWLKGRTMTAEQARSLCRVAWQFKWRAIWCPEPESNRYAPFQGRRILSPLRLPISPPGLTGTLCGQPQRNTVQQELEARAGVEPA